MFFAGLENYTKMRVGGGCDRLLPSSTRGSHSLLDTSHRSEETVRFDEVSKMRHLVGESFVANVLCTQSKVLTSKKCFQVNRNCNSIFSSFQTLEKYVDSYANTCKIHTCIILNSICNYICLVFLYTGTHRFECTWANSVFLNNYTLEVKFYKFIYTVIQLYYKKVLHWKLKPSMLSKTSVKCRLIYDFL